MYRYGEIRETIYDKNEIIDCGNISQIVIKDKNQNFKCLCTIDTEDVPKISGYKWYESAGYCVTKGVDNQNGIDISNVIFDDFTHKYDHANNNRLDNRKLNLRVCTSHENAMNMGKKCTNTSGVTGVLPQKYRRALTGKWTANITYNYQPIWLGSYSDFDEAVLARLKGEAQYFAEFAPNYNV